MMEPLYRRVLGDRFDRLPARVRELHDLRTASAWAGRADVERGKSWIARLGAALTSLPPEGRNQPLRVTFEPRGAAEVWRRQFGTSVFPSVQYEHQGRLCERVGLITFVFALAASTDGLALDLRKMRLLGIPLPRIVHPAIATFESEQEGRYRFQVEARLPLFGLLVRYAGWLEQADARASA